MPGKLSRVACRHSEPDVAKLMLVPSPIVRVLKVEKLINARTTLVEDALHILDSKEQGAQILSLVQWMLQGQ